MYLALIVLPLLGSIVSGFFGRKVGVSGSQLITTTCITITTILALIAFIEVGLNNIPVTINLFRWLDVESLDIHWAFNFDSLTVSMLIPVLVVSSLVHLYSIGYMSHDPHNQRFFSYLSLFTFMMIILVTANNFLLMFVGWEGVGICSYLLVSFWFTRISANQSSISAFLTNRVGDCFLTIGMFAMLISFGNIDYYTIFSIAPFYSENVITIIGICLLIGAMAKSSQVGLHVWLPMAMEGPTPVSALIHAATMVTAGVYLLMRMSPLIEYSSIVLILCLWVGAITTVFSSLIGLFQQDIKKVIAYSTMSQLGMMVIAIGLSSYNIALFHLVNHAFYKGLLFLGAGSVIHAVSDNQDFRKYGGLIHYLPLTYSVMLIASLSLVAIPFMTGFYSKDLILESAYGGYYLSSITVYLVATIGAMFTTLYSVKVMYLTFLTTPNGPLVNYKEINSAHEGDIYMSLPLKILAVFSIFFGYLTKDIFIGLASGFFADNSLFIHPVHETMLETEFAVPIFFKLLPFLLTITLTLLSLLFTEMYSKLLINFKFSSIGYNTFSFFNQRFLIELFYNRYISGLVIELGGQTTKVLDKGSVEIFGPYGLQTKLKKISLSINSLSTGLVTAYALYILIGLTFFISVLYYINVDEYIELLILLFAFTSMNYYPNEQKKMKNTMQSNINYIYYHTLGKMFITNKFSKALIKNTLYITYFVISLAVVIILLLILGFFIQYYLNSSGIADKSIIEICKTNLLWNNYHVVPLESKSLPFKIFFVLACLALFISIRLIIYIFLVYIVIYFILSWLQEFSIVKFHNTTTDISIKIYDKISNNKGYFFSLGIITLFMLIICNIYPELSYLRHFSFLIVIILNIVFGRIELKYNSLFITLSKIFLILLYLLFRILFTWCMLGVEADFFLGSCVTDRNSRYVAALSEARIMVNQCFTEIIGDTCPLDTKLARLNEIEPRMLTAHKATGWTCEQMATLRWLAQSVHPSLIPTPQNNVVPGTVRLSKSILRANALYNTEPISLHNNIGPSSVLSAMPNLMVAFQVKKQEVLSEMAAIAAMDARNAVLRTGGTARTLAILDNPAS